MSDKIRVAVRIRPLINREALGGFRKNNWKTQNNESIYQVDVSGKMIGNPYSFDVVFEQEQTNEDIFEQIAVPIVDASVAGFHGTIFAYGQTSSGKTYTMSGTPTDPGLIPRSVTRIFNYIDQTLEREFLLRVSYMEIYNEKICDLLAKDIKQLAIKENYDGQLYVQNLEEITVTSKEQLLQLMRQGDLNRRTGETNMNERSSRSHSIFRLVIESQLRGGDGSAVIVSHFNLVDLAGSERVSQTGATGERLREGCHINKSLSTLCLVIYKLSIGEDFVNYRDSKLTRILQGALGGNSRTSIICTVTPASVEETHSTLKFANNAKAIKNKPIVNEVLTDAAMLKRYEQEISQLKSQLTDKSDGKLLSDLEWRSMQEELDKKDEEKRSLAQKIEKLQREVLSSQLPPPGETFGQKVKRRETCCIGMLPKKNNLTAATTDDFNFKRPLSILPPYSGRESRDEFVSPDVAFASLPCETSSEPPSAPSRRLSLSPPCGRRGVVLFNPVVTALSPEARPSGQCDCGLRLEEFEYELEELRDKCENLQNVNDMMKTELEEKKDFSMMEKDPRFMSPSPTMLLSPAPQSLRRTRTLMSPAALFCASPQTSRLSVKVTLKEQLEVALSERDEARREIEDLKNFLGIDMDMSHDKSHDLNQTTTDVATLRQQRDHARESLACKRVVLADTQDVVERLREGLETCHGSLIQAEQTERQREKSEELMRDKDEMTKSLQEQVDELVEKLEHKEVVLVETKEELDKMRETLDHVFSDLSEQQSRCEDLEVELKQAQGSESASRECSSSLETLLEEKEAELTEYRSTVERLENQAQLDQENISTLESARSESQTQMTELKTLLEEKESKLGELVSLVEQLQTTNVEITEHNQSLQSSDRENSQKFRELEEHCSQLVTERESLISRNQDSDRICEELRREIEKLVELQSQESNERQETLQTRVTELQARVTELEASVRTGESERHQLERRNEELTEAVAAERGSNDNMREDIQEKSLRIEELESIRTELTTSLEKTQNELLILENLIAAGREELLRLENICDSLDKELLEEQNKNGEILQTLESERAKSAELEQQLAAASDRESDDQRKVDELEEAVGSYQDFIERGKAELDRVERICDEMDSELNQKQDKVTDLENQLSSERAGHEETKAKLDSELAELESIQAQLGSKLAENSELLAQLTSEKTDKNDIQEQLVSEKAKNADIVDQLAAQKQENAEIRDKLPSADTDGGKEVEELRAKLSMKQLTVEAFSMEISRLEKICDELEAELEEEQTKTAALERQVHSQGGKVVLPASGPSNKELESMKRELSAKEIRITRHLGEEKRLRTVLEKSKQDLIAERRRSEILHQQLQSEIALGCDGECSSSSEKLMAIENKYKSSLEERVREVMRLKSELRRVSQLQDQTIIQPERKASTRPAPPSKPGAPCTGSGVTDDIALYTLEAKNAHLEREMKKLTTEKEEMKTTNRDMRVKMAEAYTDMHKWKRKAEELEEKFSSLSTTGEGKENALVTPPQPWQRFLGKGYANPAYPLFDHLNETEVKAESTVTDSPDDCKQS